MIIKRTEEDVFGKIKINEDTIAIINENDMSHELAVLYVYLLGIAGGEKTGITEQEMYEHLEQSCKMTKVDIEKNIDKLCELKVCKRMGEHIIVYEVPYDTAQEKK